MTLLIAQILFIGTAIALSIIILLQQSKGASLGASFGSGASGTVFGARGAGSFLYKLTRILALVFFLSALGMGYLQNKSVNGPSILQKTQLEAKKETGIVDVPTFGEDNGAPASNTSSGIPTSKTQTDHNL